MKKKYSLSKSKHYLFLILSLFSFLSKTYSQLAMPPALATSNVTEASQYRVMYQLDIPDNGNFGSALTYAIDNSTLTGLSYNRIAYFMQLDSKWVWVSMDKFNTTNDQLGIPYANSGIIFQQQVTGMNVYSSVGAGVTNTVNANGNIEIWPDCYGTGLGLGTIGGNGGNYDFNDTQNPGTNCFGSFQVHNFDAAETIFAYNSFVNNSNDDLGIGNNIGNGNPDWTFMSNAASYTTKTLYVLMYQDIDVLTQPSALTVNACNNATIAPLTVSVSVNAGDVTGYTWYSNTINSNTSGTMVATSSSSLTSNSYTPSTTSTGTLYHYCTITSSTGGTVTTNPSGDININALPNLTITTSSSTLCAGTTASLTASGAVTYTWLPSNSNATSLSGPLNSTKTFTLNGTDANGCTNSTTQLMVADPIPTITVNSGAVCEGNSYTITPGGASTYTVSGGTSIVTPSVTTSYTVTGTNTFGCVGSKNCLITVNTLPTISVNNGTICSGNSFTMVPSGASTYTYSNGSAVVAPTANATYSVNGTDVNGCISATSAVSSVSVNTLPTISVTSGAICAGQSYTIIANGASTYTSVPSLAGPVVTPTATTNYSITGTDANGCVSSNTAVSSVTVHALPTISVNSGAICTGNSFTMTPSGASTYTYSNGSAVATPTANASYNVTGTDANGCISSSAAMSSVTVNALPTISINSGTICSGNSFTMTPSGASTYTYSNGSAVATPTANASYNVTGTDVNGCISSSAAVSSVTVNALPMVMASTSTTLLCTGHTATLSAMGATSYTWSTTETTTDIAVTPTSTAVYTVTGTDANGCVNTTTVQQDVSLCTGIQSVSNQSSLISVYPNPTAGIVNIELENLNGNNASIQILNTLGEVLMNESVNTQYVAFDIQHFTAGVYFVKVIENNKQQIIKLIKQ